VFLRVKIRKMAEYRSEGADCRSGRWEERRMIRSTLVDFQCIYAISKNEQDLLVVALCSLWAAEACRPERVWCFYIY